MFNDSMTHRKSELMRGKQNLGKGNIRRGIFRGKSFSLLLFVLAMPLLTMIIWKVKITCYLGKVDDQIIHLLFMDDIKVCERN